MNRETIEELGSDCEPHWLDRLPTRRERWISFALIVGPWAFAAVGLLLLGK